MHNAMDDGPKLAPIVPGASNFGIEACRGGSEMIGEGG
jgi:hypothetical protein